MKGLRRGLAVAPAPFYVLGMQVRLGGGAMHKWGLTVILWVFKWEICAWINGPIYDDIADMIALDRGSRG